MRAIKVGQVEGANAPVIATVEQRFQLLLAHPGMIGLSVAAAHAGALAETAHLDFGLAEGDGLIGIEEGGFRVRGLCQWQTGEYPAQTESGPFHKLTTWDLHKCNRW